jgi:hypothetical protein
MKRGVGWLWVCLAALAAAPDASAQSNNLTKLRTAEEELLAYEVRSVNKVCEGSLSANFVWDGFVEADFDKYSGAGYCDNVLNALEALCAKEEGKQAVRARIKQVVCKKGDKREVALAEGVVTYTIDWKRFDSLEFIRDYLEDALEE